MQPDCTLTTACFDLTQYNNKGRPLIDCVNNMRALLVVPCYLVIYTDSACVELIKEIRNQFDHLTQYNISTFEELRCYKYNDIVKKNREAYHPTQDDRTCSESHLVCCSKYDFVLQTIDENPFNTSKFGWIDSNLNVNFSKICENYNDQSLINVLNRSTDKFHLQILNVNDKRFKYKEKHEFYQRYRWVICGCLFITPVEIGVKILTRLNEIFEETTMAGYGHGEEMFCLEVLDEFYDDIERSYGDYGQILNNFIYPTRNLHYIYNYIIRSYFDLGYYKECYDCCQKTLHSIEQLNVQCQADIYMSILFSYYASSYYINHSEIIQISNHIQAVCRSNASVQFEYYKYQKEFTARFKYWKALE